MHACIQPCTCFVPHKKRLSLHGKTSCSFRSWMRWKWRTARSMSWRDSSPTALRQVSRQLARTWAPSAGPQCLITAQWAVSQKGCPAARGGALLKDISTHTRTAFCDNREVKRFRDAQSSWTVLWQNSDVLFVLWNVCKRVMSHAVMAKACTLLFFLRERKLCRGNLSQFCHNICFWQCLCKQIPWRFDQKLSTFKHWCLGCVKCDSQVLLTQKIHVKNPKVLNLT